MTAGIVAGIVLVIVSILLFVGIDLALSKGNEQTTDRWRRTEAWLRSLEMDNHGDGSVTLRQTDPENQLDEDLEDEIEAELDIELRQVFALTSPAGDDIIDKDLLVVGRLSLCLPSDVGHRLHIPHSFHRAVTPDVIDRAHRADYMVRKGLTDPRQVVTEMRGTEIRVILREGWSERVRSEWTPYQPESQT